MENKQSEPVLLNSENPKDVVTFFYEHLNKMKEDGEFHKFLNSGTNTLLKLIEENEKLRAENESLKK